MFVMLQFLLFFASQFSSNPLLLVFGQELAQRYRVGLLCGTLRIQQRKRALKFTLSFDPQPLAKAHSHADRVSQAAMNQRHHATSMGELP